MATRKLNNNYLYFNALSIKDAINKKLAEDVKFTDMNLEDSNMSILIDIFAQTYQTMLYYLNSSASETLFSDTTLYENMNRLVKFIGYNPLSYQPGAVSLIVSGFNDSGKPFQKILPKYSYLVAPNVNSVSSGDVVIYSTIEDTYIYNTAINPNATNTVVVYDGYWKLYERTFTATGIPSETFLLDKLTSNTEAGTYQSLSNIDVFVKRYKSDGTYEWLIFKCDTDNLFIRQNNTSYGSYDRVFQARLNEYKQVEIKFGDGVNGDILKSGDEIYVAYLKSLGPASQIGAGNLDEVKFAYGIAGLNTSTFNEIFQVNSDLWFTTTELTDDITVSNSEGSSVVEFEESVDDIRENAPKWFRRLGKLTTKDDFRNFILSNYKYDIIDAKIFNNYSYLAEFYGWLYNYQEKSGNTFITKNLRNKYDYEFADAADSNNVYACIKFKNNISVTKRTIERAVNVIKPLTSELVFIDPLVVRFTPCAYNLIEDPTRYDINSFDTQYENYFEILVSDTSIVSAESVKTRIINLITNYFAADNQLLGAEIDIQKLYTDILALDGVSRVRTVFKDATSATPTLIVPGLRFAFWTPAIINGADLDVTNSLLQLENFQFPELYDVNNFSNRVKIIVESSSPLPNIEF